MFEFLKKKPKNTSKYEGRLIDTVGFDEKMTNSMIENESKDGWELSHSEVLSSPDEVFPPPLKGPRVRYIFKREKKL